MQVHIETRSIPLPRNSRMQIAARIERYLGRMAGRVKRLRVSLVEATGKSGETSKLCRIHARLAQGKEIVVTDKSRSTARSLFRGLRRLKRMLAQSKPQKRRSRMVQESVAA